MLFRLPDIPRSARPYVFVGLYILTLGLLAYLGYLGISQYQAAQVAKTHATAHENVAIGGAKSLYNLPRMDLTLSTFQGATHHARIGISVEVDKNNLERFTDFQPRVSDRIINFLRAQDIDEIRKPEAMFGLRRDLLKEINIAADPIPVSDIIFREFVVR